MTHDNTFQLQLINENGLHMRPATALLKAINGLDYAVAHNGETKKSPGIIGYMTFEAKKGGILEFSHSYQGNEGTSFYNAVLKVEVPDEGRLFAEPSGLEEAVVESDPSDLPALAQ